MNEVSQVLRALNQQPIAYIPLYKAITGSIHSGILLSQLMYWHSRMGKEFYVTDDDLRNQLMFTERELRTAKSHIRDIPFLKIVKKGIPCKTYYDVDYDLFCMTVKNVIEDVNSSIDKIVSPSVDKTVITGDDKTVQAITKTTTKITTDIKNNKKEEPYEFSKEGLEAIYNEYPKKVGKANALKSIKKALNKINHHDLLLIVREYAKKISWQDKQFIPNPATWFNQERWNDDRSTWLKPKPKYNQQQPSRGREIYDRDKPSDLPQYELPTDPDALPF